jgi:LysM repeat protein
MTAPYVTFTPLVEGASIRVLLGSSAAVASSDGGWAVLSRPKKSGFTAWEGYAPYQMTLSIMFDGLANDVSQESEYRALLRIMRQPVGKAEQPSPVRLSGPVPMTSTPWVIQSVEQEADSIIRREDGQIVRVAVAVNLLEYVEADVLVTLIPSPAKKVNAKTAAAPGAGKTYTVKRGDTLSKIAQSQLGSWSRFREIATLNGIRDPNRVSVGQVLRLP